MGVERAHQLQNQRLRTFTVFKTVNSRDVGVVQACENLRLSLDPRTVIRISGHAFGQDLQRHLPVQLGISG